MDEIKQLEQKERKLEKEIERVRNARDELMDIEMKKNILRIKKEVEHHNEQYGGDCIEELNDLWKKEEEERKANTD